MRNALHEERFPSHKEKKRQMDLKLSLPWGGGGHQLGGDFSVSIPNLLVPIRYFNPFP